MNLQIGTASFANEYGILNSDILNNENEIRDILEFCSKKNLILDSSPNYGLSLNFIDSLSNDIKTNLNTKVTIGNNDLEVFTKKLSNHLDSIKNCSIDTIYFHEPKASHHSEFKKILLSTKKLIKNHGVKKIGLSIYNEKDFLASNCIIDLIDCIQIPINILDKRNISLKNNHKDIKLIGRSIYLQGLLTSKGIKLLENSSHMKDVKNAFLISKLAKKFNTNIEILAIASVLNLEEIDTIILGINSFKQLKESISFYNEAKKLSIEIKQKKDLYKGIDTDGSTFERWLPALSKK